MRLGLALALAVILAGCGAKAPGGPGGGAGGAEVGAIEGVVVSEAIVPLAGVHLGLQPGARNATTDAQGRFAFADLAPGAYTVTAHVGGYADAQAAVQVAAGDAPPVQRIVLVRDALAGNYFEAYSYDGLVDESFEAGPLSGNAGDTTANYTIGTRAPDLVQSELVWSSTQSLGSNLQLMAIADDGGNVVPVMNSTEGPSPLLLKLDAGLVQQYKLGPRVQLELSVFSGQSQGAGPDKGVGVVASQRFTIFTHMFYGYLPPPEWRFSADGDPPPPA